ncbi:AlpA family phage regulatory protein [Sinorhizobium meliloti]|nr:AlpA family phage regulatory protein [Sinorhizobium meliloti]
MTDRHDERDPIAPLQRKKIIRAKDMPAETGLSIRAVWEAVSEGTLPPPAQLSRRAVGWFSDELEEWREQKRRERDECRAVGCNKDLKNAEGSPKKAAGPPAQSSRYCRTSRLSLPRSCRAPGSI